MAKSAGFSGKKHSAATKAKISASMAARKGPTKRLDGPSNLTGGGATGTKLVGLKPKGPVRLLAGALAGQIKQDAAEKVRSTLMLRPSITPDDRSLTVSATRRQRNSGGKERYTDTLTISRGSDYRTGRVYEKHRRPIASQQRAKSARKLGNIKVDPGGRGSVSVKVPQARGL